VTETAVRLLLAAMTIVAAGASASSVNGDRESRFTKLNDAVCGTRHVWEETGDWARDCPAVKPFTLRWISGDLREDLLLFRGSREYPLDLPIRVAKGAFDTLGETIEWRGPRGKRADVLIVRVKVADSGGVEDGGHLAIFKLSPTPCLIAVVRPQPGQSDQARAIADRAPLPNCLPA
jgi:hypothetical protein